MRSSLRIATVLFLLISGAKASMAQVVPVLTDDFESYTPYQVCPAYNTDIQVYPTHGTNGSQGLRSFMNTFDSKDSLLINWISPLPSAYIDFDFRIMEASALYPNIAATLDAGDQFSLRYTPNNQGWIVLQNWKASNFTPTTSFTHVHLPITACDSAKFKFVITRTSNPTDYFVDIDNLDISNYQVGVASTIENTDLKISPSPFSDMLRIQAPVTKNYDFELIDLHGQVIEKGNITGGEVSILTATLPAGNYMVRVTGADRIKTFRVIKAK